MSHMNSVRVPATMIFTALMVLILLSSSRTTYTFGPAPNEKTRAAGCPTAPAASTKADEPRRFCPRPRLIRHGWTQEAGASAAD